MGNEKTYWINKKSDHSYSCHNISLFRFLGQNNITPTGKHVIDFGFGANHGEDLLEMHRRGAVYCMGVDINPIYVDQFNKEQQILDRKNIYSISSDIGKMDFVTLKDKFQLSFSRDTINYLSDKEILHFFQGLVEIGEPGSFSCIQFLEKDIKIPTSTSLSFESLKFDSANIVAHHEENNPLKFLNPDHIVSLASKCNLILKAHKTNIQSFGRDTSSMRVDKYLLFQIPE